MKENMNLRKGLSFLAFGYLFVLVNFNLELNNLRVNLMPEFVGWILLFLAVPQLGSYTQDKPLLRWAPLALAVVSGLSWASGILLPEIPCLSRFQPLTGLLSAWYLYVLFGVLEVLAEDIGSNRGPTIRLLKYINVALALGVNLAAQIYAMTELEVAALAMVALGMLSLGAAIATLIVLFGLRKDAIRAGD